MKKILSLVLAVIMLAGAASVTAGAVSIKVPKDFSLNYNANFCIEVVINDLPEEADIVVIATDAEGSGKCLRLANEDNTGYRYICQLKSDTTYEISVCDKTTGTIYKDTNGNDMTAVVNVKCRDNFFIRFMNWLTDLLHLYSYSEKGTIKANLDYNWQ